MKVLPFTGAVMAGGASRRMGQDKAMLTLDGEPLWLRQVGVFRTAGAHRIGIVRQPTQAPLALPPGINLWHDEIIGAGPLAGLHAALSACTTDLLAVVATDMPRIDATWFQWLLGFCRPGCGAMARHSNGGHEPLAAIYPRIVLSGIMHRLHTGPRSLQSLADNLIAGAQLVSVPLPAARIGQVANWNTPAEIGTLPPAWAHAS